MDNRYYDNVIAEMKPFLEANGFKASDDGFINETKKVEVKYNEDKQTYSLLVATKDDEGKFGEFNAINTWLFDDSQNAKDAGSVGIDFVVSLRKELGVKIARTNTNIELPTANKSGNMTVSGFAKKMLDIFPAIKDDYKEHVNTYGNFLYLNFFGEYLVPELVKLFSIGTKKQIKKIYDTFEDVYVKGDNETVNVMLSLLAATAIKDENCKTAIDNMLTDNSHFFQSYKSIFVKLPKSKKLYTALIK